MPGLWKIMMRDKRKKGVGKIVRSDKTLFVIVSVEENGSGANLICLTSSDKVDEGAPCSCHMYVTVPSNQKGLRQKYQKRWDEIAKKYPKINQYHHSRKEKRQ